MGKDSLTWTVDNGPPASARWSCSWCGTTIQADGASHDSVVLPTGEVICVTCDADVVGLRRPDDG